MNSTSHDSTHLDPKCKDPMVSILDPSCLHVLPTLHTTLCSFLCLLPLVFVGNGRFLNRIATYRLIYLIIMREFLEVRPFIT